MRRDVFDAAHDDFRDSVRTFLEREVHPDLPKYQADHAFARDMWLAFGRQGLLGLEIPEEYGGAEARDFRFNAVLTEELSREVLALASAHGIHANIVAAYLVELTTPEQRQRWLPRFVTGELLCAIAMTEPSGGSDLAARKTNAVADGSDWILKGSKTFITNGGSVDLVLVAARTDPDAKPASGISLLVVDADMAGFSRGRKLDKVGQDEADTAELFFDNVRVPAENVVGEVNRGFIHMMTWLPQERLTDALGNVAHAAQILQETIEYTTQRTAFGQTIASFQHNKFLLAELVTQIEVAQAFIDQCIRAHVRGELTPVDAAKAKWWASEVQNDVLDHCVQLYGGYGFMNEYRAARAWRDARVTKIWAGSNEIMKELIGRSLGI